MGSRYVVKVQYENSLRRLALGEAELDFSQLESRVRELFQISPSAALLFTYIDKDGDVVTMVDDQDLKDALVLQSINPLRLKVTFTGTQKSAPIAEQQQSGIAPQPTVVETSSSDQEKKSVIEDVAIATETAADTPTPAENESTVEEPQLVPATSSNEGTSAPESKHSEEPAVPAADSKHGQIHLGIECDGCEMTPIIGPRFKSTKKVNYDLCQSCFEGSNSVQDDYIKMDQSADGMLYPLHFLTMMKQLSERQRLSNRCGPCKPTATPASKASTSSAPAADATPASTAGPSSADAEKVDVKHRGVQCDGCGMNPIVGPRLISRTRWNYDLCTGCFEKSGGDEEKFQRVEEPARENRVVLERKLQLVSPYGPFGPRFGRYVWVPKPSSATEDKATRGEDKAGHSHQESSKEEPPATESVTRESIESQAVNTDASEAVDLAERLPAEDLPIAQEGLEDVKEDEPEDDLSTQKGLLSKLAAMGFTDQKLNTDVLQRNEFDLRKSLDDLCAAEEWDPILEDLQEMGFHDAAINRSLLFKYNGNVKRVVKELVQLSKDVGNGKGLKEA